MEWISVTNNNLPPTPFRKNVWKRYIVSCIFTHDSVFSTETQENIVTTALYDHNQKIWHLDNDMCINSLCCDSETPLCGDYVTHWMPMPEPPEGD